jgi:hypothetical protein
MQNLSLKNVFLAGAVSALRLGSSYNSHSKERILTLDLNYSLAEMVPRPPTCSLQPLQPLQD